MERLVKRLVPHRARQPVRLALTAAIARGQGRIARRNLGYLHFGCYRNRLPGWINVDLVGVGADLKWDVRKPLPWPSGSAPMVFHEHLLEHLDPADAAAFTRECWRVLVPGGVLRVVVPDGSRPEHFPPCFGHKVQYTPESLLGLLRDAGFAEPRIVAFKEGVDLRPDSPARAQESMYAEAVR